MPINGEPIKPSSLYISLNSRPKKGEYHWGLVVMEGNQTGMLHHASNLSGGWKYETRKVNPANSLSLIVLVFVSHISDLSAAQDVIRRVPANGTASLRTGEAFTCRIFVKDVMVALHEAGHIQLPASVDALEERAKELAGEFASTTESGGGATVVSP